MNRIERFLTAVQRVLANIEADRARPVRGDSLRTFMNTRRQAPRPRRKPPEAGIAVPAVPPKGPLPMQGGAEAPLEFDT